MAPLIEKSEAKTRVFYADFEKRPKHSDRDIWIGNKCIKNYWIRKEKKDQSIGAFVEKLALALPPALPPTLPYAFP